MTTIPQMLRQQAQQCANADAIIDGAWRLSYGELQAHVLQAAAVLRQKGLGRGDCFAIWAPNCAEWIIACLAGQVLGAIMVPLNTRYKGGEAADILRRAHCKILFTVNGFLGTNYPQLLASHDLPELKEIIVMRAGQDDCAAMQDFLQAAATPLDPSVLDETSDDDLCDILYTSGTTGLPKGVMTAHGQNISVFDSFSSAIGMTAQDRYLVVNPFFHSFGYKAGWLSCLIRGAAIYPLPIFDVDEVLRRIEEDRITVMPGAPTIFQSLLASPTLATRDISSLRIATTGAAMIPVDLIRQMHEEIGIDHVFSAYGMTESCGVITLCQKGDDFATIATTCGRPLPGTEVKLVDDAGEQVASGAEGEIWVRGFNVMRGYYEDAAASAETITADGWLKTGDIGVQDDAGYIKITDRKKDMIIVGGFNCYPAEVERILLTHDKVKDVAVKAMADQRLGEVPQAFVVAADLDEAELIAWARNQMANFKVPRKISFLTELPRNASGKILKYQL